ncbi:hypothetical protein PCANC_26936 [Puccinia coronata f. sp. avenae]|uniref:Uncharacterized protein n=1 Tax=Puccinia coronata f. sp. avenae TaxID=200324 RepID=A0A2N5U2U9_9BASI|nr:hypothetical protein PCANC_26936 [Puccinia coronata f. sp. avenae]
MASWAPRRQSARPANGYLLGIRPNRKGLVGLWDPDECDRGAAAPTASRQAAASRDLHRRPGGRPDQPSPASRLACSPSRCSYQPNEQASLLAEPALVPAQRAGSYQPSKRVSMLDGLVQVPARRSGQPARQAGTCTSPAIRSTCSPSRCSCQPNEQASLCQNMSRSVAHDDDTLMQSISDELGRVGQGDNSQGTT